MPFEQKFQFTDFIPPGEHYFYFIRVLAPPPSPEPTPDTSLNFLQDANPDNTDSPALNLRKQSTSNIMGLLNKINNVDKKPQSPSAISIPSSKPAQPRSPTQHDRHFFCLSELYEIKQCPGSQMQMNYINIPQNDDYELSAFRQFKTQNRRNPKRITS